VSGFIGVTDPEITELYSRLRDLKIFDNGITGYEVEIQHTRQGIDRSFTFVVKPCISKLRDALEITHIGKYAQSAGPIAYVYWAETEHSDAYPVSMIKDALQQVFDRLFKMSVEKAENAAQVAGLLKPEAGLDKLFSKWLSGLRDDVVTYLDTGWTVTFTTKAKPDEETPFILYPSGNGKYPDRIRISHDGVEMLGWISPHKVEGESAIFNVLVNENPILCADDIGNNMDKILGAVKRMVENPHNNPPVSLTPEKEAPMSAQETPVVKAGKPEFTLGVYPPIVNSVLGEHYCNINLAGKESADMLTQLNLGAMGGRRELLAKLDLVCQLIGYGLHFRVRNGDIEFMVYKRNKKNKDSEKQLTSVFSLGTGGHAEAHKDFFGLFANGVRTAEMDVAQTAFVSSHRESLEEIRVTLNGEDITHDVAQTANIQGFVRDSQRQQGYVGNHHFGVVMSHLVPDGAEVELIEPNNEFVGWYTAQQLITALFLQPRAREVNNRVAFVDGDKQSIIHPKTEDGWWLDTPDQIDVQLVDWDFEPWSAYIIPHLGLWADNYLTEIAAAGKL